MRPIADHIDILLRKTFARHDKTFAEVMINWPKITGASFSSRTSPIKISTVTEKGQKIKILYVKTADAATSLEFTYHQNIILERIAVYFGHRAIDKLYIKIG